MTRIDQLLPMLQCPIASGPLQRLNEWQLASVGEPIAYWPVLDGMPDFRVDASVKHAPLDENRPTFDYSSGMSTYARFHGPCLNLRPGNSVGKPPNIIEVDEVPFSTTDILVDFGTCLPFADNTFEFVACVTGFENYRRPQHVADEIYRVLKPGGEIFVQGASMMPVFKEPPHYFCATRFGYETWFSKFAIDSITVPPAFNPWHTLTWFAHNLLYCIRSSAPHVAEQLETMSVAELSRRWLDDTTRSGPLYDAFLGLPEPFKQITALGFEVRSRKPG